MLAKLLKIIRRVFLGLIELTCIVGAFVRGKEMLCFPVGFAIAGLLAALTAKRHALGGSTLKWGIYGALVPVVSWIDVVMSCSQSKAKGFLKGLAYSFAGILVFLVVFAQFLPPVQLREQPQQEAQNQANAFVSEDKSSAALVLEPPAPKNSIVAVPVRPAPIKSSQTVTSTPRKSEPEKISVYLSENRVILDPNDVDDEPAPRPARKSSRIANKGKEYHYASCRTVRGSYTALTVSQARSRGYTPCKVCSPPPR